MRAQAEYDGNQTNKRGLVVERDPKKHRVKVQFVDEDETVTHWIDVVAKSATGTSFFTMPGQGDEVWCAMDAKGEDGCLIGAKYNDKDGAPYEGNEDVGMKGAWGSVHVNTDTGDVSVETSGAVAVTIVGDVIIDAANITLTSGTLTHNGKNIGHDHTHTGVMPGSGTSGPPS